MKILNPIMLPARVGKSELRVNDANDKPLLLVARRYEEFGNSAQLQIIRALNSHADLIAALRGLLRNHQHAEIVAAMAET